MNKIDLKSMAAGVVLAFANGEILLNQTAIATMILGKKLDS